MNGIHQALSHGIWKETKTIAKIPPPVFQFVKSPRNKNQYFKRCNPVRTMLFSLFSKTVTETDKSAKKNLINKSQYPAKAKNTFQHFATL